MPFPESAARLENLQRAWQWIRSNPDRTYKSHGRPRSTTQSRATIPFSAPDFSPYGTGDQRV
jgi:hypothetical protein